MKLKVIEGGGTGLSVEDAATSANLITEDEATAISERLFYGYWVSPEEQHEHFDFVMDELRRVGARVRNAE